MGPAECFFQGNWVRNLIFGYQLSLFETLSLVLIITVIFRAKVIFGLNALNGRKIQSDGSAAGAWNYSNAESLIRYTFEKKYSIFAWELGKNEFTLFLYV